MPAPKASEDPGHAVRGERLFVRLERLVAGFDGWLSRWLPEPLNPLLQSGRVTNLSLLIAVVSGVLLLFWYSPSVEYAHRSLADIEGWTLGGWVRALHRYSSDLVMLMLCIHAARMLLARKFAGSRWLAWVSGVAMMSLVWFIGWTGYWLVWDQPAQQVAVTSMQFLDVLPIFGEPMGRQFLADRMVPSLLFFVVFFTHMLLPLMIAVGLVFHLSRLNRVQLLPGRGLCLALTGGLAVASLLVPAPLDPAAEMAVKPEAFTVDAWYLTPLALGLRLQSLGLWVAVVLTMLLAMSIPWVLGRKRKKLESAERGPERPAPQAFYTVVDEVRCHACTQCYQDCPFDAVRMIPRTDGKKAFATAAWVDPVRCVGCAVCVGSCDSEAMHFPSFDFADEEQRIQQRAESAMDQGEPVWLALVAADSEGGVPYFQKAIWEKRLPGYQVECIPTASWIRSKWLERLMKKGLKGVLIVRDGRIDTAQARDGNRWIAERLSGERKPVFRPSRSDGNQNFKVVDYRPGQSREVERLAAEFKDGVEGTREHRRGGVRVYASAALVIAAVLAAAVWPSHLQVSNPADPRPELVFSFRSFGELKDPETDTSEEDDSRPVHMQGRATAKPERHPVTVRLHVDGETEEQLFRARGISRDGPAIDELRRFLQSGEREVAIELIRGPEAEAERWSGTIAAEARRLHVITYEPGSGFRVE